MLRKSLRPGTDAYDVGWMRGVIVVTIGAWLPILVGGVQTWWNWQATEDSAYNHLLDSAQQIERGVERFLSENRLLGQAIFDAIPLEREGSDDACPLMCPDVLEDIRRRYLELFPGLELLIIDPDGHTIVETEPDMQSRVTGLGQLARHFRTRSAALAAVSYAKNSRNEPALRVARAQRGPKGELKFVAVIFEPANLLREILAAPQLGAGRAVTIVDKDGILLARDPPATLVHVGHQLTQFISDRRPARGLGSFRAVSKIDHVDRLWIMREIRFSWAAGGLTIYVGASKNDYEAGWYRFALLNVFIGLSLLVGWAWSLNILRQSAHSRAQALATVSLLHKVMASTPLPLVVVSQAEGHVVMSNVAMLNLFGALATAGQPVRQLFREEQAFGLLHDSQLPLLEAQLVSRKGMIQAELHRTDLGDLGGTYGKCWLMVMVDISERHKREQHLQLEATTDGLTGLSNRRHFMLVAEQKIATARQQGTPVAVLAADLDHFKRVNDEHGHDIGDLVLTTAARVFKGVLRDSDEAARAGGEEFVALLPRADREQAVMVGERIRRAIASTPILLPDSGVLMLTVSIGVGLWQADDADVQAALKRADMALYAAKQKGRNRVEIQEDSEPRPKQAV